MKVDNKLVNKAAARNRKKERLEKLKNFSVPTWEDLKHFDFTSINRKKAIAAGVIFLLFVILLRGFAGMKDVSVPQDPISVSGKIPAFDTLTVDDIMTGKVQRPYSGKKANNIDLDKLVPILNDIVFIENMEPFEETGSKGTYFTLYMEDGSKTTITAADNYLTINGVGWKVDAQSYNDLIEFATQTLKK